jgi:ABC-2 type transporter
MDAAIDDIGSPPIRAEAPLAGMVWMQTATLPNTALHGPLSIMCSHIIGQPRTIFTPLNIIKSVCIVVVAGMLWWRMEHTEECVHDRSSYYFFTMTFWVFDSMRGARMAFPAERDVILKERASGTYHLSAYFLAKTTRDAPVRLILPFLYMFIFFWMAGIVSRFSVFVSSTCCTLLCLVAGEALGLLVGTSMHDITKATTVMIVSRLFLLDVARWLLRSTYNQLHLLGRISESVPVCLFGVLVTCLLQ